MHQRVLSTRAHVAIALAVLIVNLSSVGGPALAYEIGHRIVTYVDPARGDRQIQTDLYYPADIAGEQVPVSTAPPGGFPVLAFGHGYLIGTAYYEYVWEGLVPLGYILALPRTEGGLVPNHEALGLDLTFLPRRMREEGVTPGSAFYGAIANTAALLGHSMGGGASVLGAASDPEVTAIANLAAANTNPSAILAASQVTVPALLFSGSNDCVTPPAEHQIPIYEALEATWKTRVTIGGASHCQFVEAGSLCVFGEGGCPSPTITRDVQQQMTLQLVRPWLAFTLTGDRDAWAEFAGLLSSMNGISYAESGHPTGVAGPGAGDELADSGAHVGIWLAPPQPNPAGSGTLLRYHLPANGQVRVDIYTVSGRLVRSLWDGGAVAGWHAAWWDGHADDGLPTAAGVYLARLRVGVAERVQRMLIVR